MPDVIEVLTEADIVEFPLQKLEIVDVVQKGDKGDKGDSAIGAVVNFSWGDATPRLIATAITGSTLFALELHLQTAFNTASSLFIADENGNIIFEMSDLSVAAVYEIAPSLTFLSDTDLFLHLETGNGTTQGAGIFLITIQ